MNAFCLVQWAHFIYFGKREGRKAAEENGYFKFIAQLKTVSFPKAYSVHWKDNSIFHLSFLFLSVKNWNSDSLVNRTLVAKGNLKWWRQQFSIIVNSSTLLVEVCSWEIKQKPPGLLEKQRQKLWMLPGGNWINWYTSRLRKLYMLQAAAIVC